MNDSIDGRPPLIFSDLDEVIRQARESERTSEAAAFLAIKKIRAAPKAVQLDAQQVEILLRSRSIARTTPGAVAKFSRSGKFLGWYREGQTSGAPNRRSPLAQELDAQLESYLRSIREAFPPELLASLRGQRSGRSRQTNGLIARIEQLAGEMALQDVPRHHRPKKIAKRLDCTVEYVRKVLARIACKQKKQARNPRGNSTPDS